MPISIRSTFIILIALVFLGADLRAVALGQEITLNLPKDDPIENSEPVSSIAFSPDGKLIATGHGTNLGMLQKPDPGQTILWDALSGKRVKAIIALKDGVRSVTFSPDGKTLAVLEAPGIIRLIAMPEGREFRKFQINEEKRGYYSVAFFPNGELLAVGVSAKFYSQGSEVLILDIADGKRLRSLVGHVAPVTSVAVSPDGKLLASGSMDGTAKIWDSLTGKPLTTLRFAWPKADQKEGEIEAFVHWMQSVAFSPDGRTLAATASGDLGVANDSGKLGFWEISTFRSKGTLEAIDPHVQQGVFSPSGKLLLTAGIDGSAKLWDITTFKETGSIKGSYPMAFSPDGKTIAATVNTRTIVVRKTPSADVR
jgi:WD40 repeat protein